MAMAAAEIEALIRAALEAKSIEARRQLIGEA